MNNWANLIVSPTTTLLEAARVIDSGGGQIAIVANADGVVCGVVTDADVRKAILNGEGTSIPCSAVMSKNPISLPADSAEEQCLEVMRRKHIRQLLLLDKDGRLADVILLMDIVAPPRLDNPIVLMAGGLGTRLGPLTKHTPKPMLNVGSKPLLETVIEQFIQQGFHRFYFSVNYKADLIMNHFGHGDKWGVQIEYLVEHDRSGTAGSLRLLPPSITDDLVVMNGDVLTKVNFRQMLRFHRWTHSKATMAVKDYAYTIPYGVVSAGTDYLISSIEEKPTQTFFINAGIYVLSPDVLKLIPSEGFFDMPTLFKEISGAAHRSAAFPLREYWIDIGHTEDFELANSEYGEYFSPRS
jgi:dTDP-glucose pyrophosphorylase